MRFSLQQRVDVSGGEDNHGVHRFFFYTVNKNRKTPRSDKLKVNVSHGDLYFRCATLPAIPNKKSFYKHENWLKFEVFLTCIKHQAASYSVHLSSLSDCVLIAAPDIMNWSAAARLVSQLGVRGGGGGEG